MIVDFLVRNFRSIKEEMLFSMVAEKKKETLSQNLFHLLEEKDIVLLKSALIYGANASGKTNLLKAFMMLRHFILHSDELKLDQEIPYYEPFLLDAQTKNASITCEIEFVTEEPMRYRYAVEFDKAKIVSEKLTFFPRKDEILLYNRNAANEYNWGRDLKGKKQTIVDDVLSNMLFISKAANKKDSDDRIKSVYRYFRTVLRSHTAIDSTNKTSFFTSQKLKEDSDGSFRTKVIEFLKSADIGVSSLSTHQESLDISKYHFPDSMPAHLRDEIINDMSTKVELGHQVYDKKEIVDEAQFDLEEESAGTIKMYDLAGKIIATLQNGWVLLIDELDSSFHPLMSEHVLNLFNDPEKNPKNAQLIVTTHDVTLLDSEKLRRDQVWFAEKDQYGTTIIYSLDEFKKNEVRNNIPFDKWYMAGRFGALPFIDKSRFSLKVK